jgi:pyruvate/2-oxoglutarate dehydrogenase complex dihydrolipoamide acyltransferase (E2) component
MGVSVAEGTIIEWRKRVGDPVEADEAICEISTDKIDTEVPAPSDGTLAEILVDVGMTVDVGTVVARILPSVGSTGVLPTPQAAVETSAAAFRESVPRRFYSPVARRIAREYGIDLARITGTGRSGRVTKADVFAFVERPGARTEMSSAAPHNRGSPSGPDADSRPLHTDSPFKQDPADQPQQTVPATPPDASSTPVGISADDLGGVPQPLSRMRRSIGAAMLRSLELAATCTTVVECDMTHVEQRRRELEITALPLVAAAAINTLRAFPQLNATLEDDTLTRYDRVHLGIAVSLGEDGLIVPVIHDAQNLTAEGIAHRIRDLATRARGKRLVSDDIRGATFTITNPGAFGAVLATPIINIPQVAILDLEAIVRRPVVVSDSEGREAIAIRPMVNLCMSWDHRAIDGAYAAQFLTALRTQLELGCGAP